MSSRWRNATAIPSICSRARSRTYLTIIRGMRCCQEGRTLGARRQCSSPYTTTSNNASGLPGSNPQGRDFLDRISALFVACLVRLNGAPHALNCAPGNPVAPVNDYEIGSSLFANNAPVSESVNLNSTKNDGRGVGLSVSRSIIENHTGRLWAVLNDDPGQLFHS